MFWRFGGLLISLLIAGHCSAAESENEEDEAPEIPCYVRENWDRRVAEIAQCDEIRMTLAQKSGDEPYKCTKEGVITFRRRIFLDHLLRAMTGVDVAKEIVPLLEFQPNTPDSRHGCYGLFNLWFFKSGKCVGGLHYAHGTFWAPLTRPSQEKLLTWLKQHKFPIEETLSRDRKE